MNMFHRNSQSHKLIHEPSDINLTFLFRNNNHIVTLFRILTSKLNQKFVRRSYRLLHIIQATVTRYPNHTIRLEIQFKSTRCFFNDQYNIDFTLLDFRAINVSKEKVVKNKLICTRVCLHPFQIYFVFIKLSQSFFSLFGRQRYK